jgi:hypothetical protein
MSQEFADIRARRISRDRGAGSRLYAISAQRAEAHGKAGTGRAKESRQEIASFRAQ